MRAITESEWLVALHHVPGVGWHTIHKIKEVCQSFAHLPDRLKQHAAELEALRLPWRAIAEELASYERQRKMKRFREKRIDVVTVFDDRYPELLIDEKAQLFPELLERGSWLCFTHDSTCAVARLSLENGRYGAVQKLSDAELDLDLDAA